MRKSENWQIFGHSENREFGLSEIRKSVKHQSCTCCGQSLHVLATPVIYFFHAHLFFLPLGIRKFGKLENLRYIVNLDCWKFCEFRRFGKSKIYHILVIVNLDCRKFEKSRNRKFVGPELRKIFFKSKVVANYPAVRHNKHCKTNLRCTFGIEVGCYQARKSTLEKSMTSGVKLQQFPLLVRGITITQIQEIDSQKESVS